MSKHTKLALREVLSDLTSAGWVPDGASVDNTRAELTHSKSIKGAGGTHPLTLAASIASVVSALATIITRTKDKDKE
jgi:hypothetical protein